MLLSFVRNCVWTNQSRMSKLFNPASNICSQMLQYRNYALKVIHLFVYFVSCCRLLSIWIFIIDFIKYSIISIWACLQKLFFKNSFFKSFWLQHRRVAIYSGRSAFKIDYVHPLIKNNTRKHQSRTQLDNAEFMLIMTGSEIIQAFVSKCTPYIMGHFFIFFVNVRAGVW